MQEARASSLSSAANPEPSGQFTDAANSGRGAASRRALAIGALLLLSPLVLAGCHKSHRRHQPVEVLPQAFASSTEFTWSGDLRAYSAFDEYIWDTVWDEVFIEFEGFDFFGEVRVQILDDSLDEVYDETFFGSGGSLQVKTSSDLGFAGEWTVRITTWDVFGDVRLRLD